MKQSDRLKSTRDGDVLIVEWTRRGRLRIAFLRWLVVMPVAFFAMVVFFTPDILFGRVRAVEPVPGLFLLTLVLLALLGSGLFALARYLRKERWIFNGETRELLGETYVLYGTGESGRVELREIKEILLEDFGARFRASRLGVEMNDGSQEELFRARTMGADLRIVGENIRDFMRDQRYAVPLIDCRVYDQQQAEAAARATRDDDETAVKEEER